MKKSLSTVKKSTGKSASAARASSLPCPVRSALLRQIRHAYAHAHLTAGTRHGRGVKLSLLTVGRMDPCVGRQRDRRCNRAATAAACSHA